MQYISLQSFGHIMYTMEGEEESLQLRIDLSLDQDKDENHVLPCMHHFGKGRKLKTRLACEEKA